MFSVFRAHLRLHLAQCSKPGLEALAAVVVIVVSSNRLYSPRLHLRHRRRHRRHQHSKAVRLWEFVI